MDIKEGWPKWFIILLIKRLKAVVSHLRINLLLNLFNQNGQLADELHKLIIRKFKKRKVYSAFKDNIWAADLADMQLISRFNKGFKFLLYVIDIYSKYAWVVPLKDKKRCNYC